MYPEAALLVGGERRRAGRPELPVVNPATGQVVGSVPVATAADLDDAVAAAVSAFRPWAGRPAAERGRILAAAAAGLRAAADELAVPLVLENGKPLREAKAEILAAADVFDWYAGEAARTYGRTIPPRSREARFLTFREPVGVVAAFAPWNFPAVNLARKVAPALAAGCTVVAKPAEETPATPLAIADALTRAGLPPGVLNVVFGVPAEVSERLIRAPEVRKVSFTGSTAVGRHLARLAADGLKRTTMELGGHAPVIVCADADPERAADMAAAAKFRNAGQSCNSPSRFLVHRSVHGRLVARMAEVAGAIRVGDGLDPATGMGPLSNRRRLEAMDRLVEDAVGRGARVAAGGRRIGEAGWFYAPTVLDGVDDAALVMREEPFGPVAPVAAYDDLDEAIARANATPFGLAAYAVTDHLPSARRIAAEVAAGAVAVNAFVVAFPEAPFGGVRDSGWGYEGGPEGLDAYQQTKFVHEA